MCKIKLSIAWILDFHTTVTPLNAAASAFFEVLRQTKSDAVGFFLFFLLGSDVLIRYRLRFGRPHRESQASEAAS